MNAITCPSRRKSTKHDAIRRILIGISKIYVYDEYRESWSNIADGTIEDELYTEKNQYALVHNAFWKVWDRH